MKISYIIPTFALSILAIVGVAFIAQAEETTDPTLEDRVATLETLVADLQADLEDANDEIEALQAKVDTLSTTPSSDDDDVDDDEDTDSSGKSKWGKSTWDNWMNRLAGYCERTFGAKWQDPDKDFWDKFPFY